MSFANVDTRLIEFVLTQSVTACAPRYFDVTTDGSNFLDGLTSLHTLTTFSSCNINVFVTVDVHLHVTLSLWTFNVTLNRYGPPHIP